MINPLDQEHLIIHTVKEINLKPNMLVTLIVIHQYQELVWELELLQ